MASFMIRERWFLVAAVALGAAVTSIGACSSDDAAPSDAADASVGDADTTDGDPCSTYKRGTACTLAASKVCFPQCTTGGCFCENGTWTCRTDTSCFPETGPLDDATTPDDASDDATSFDAADAADATDATDDGSSDAGGDAAGDATDAADAPVDAPDAD